MRRAPGDTSNAQWLRGTAFGNHLKESSGSCCFSPKWAGWVLPLRMMLQRRSPLLSVLQGGPEPARLPGAAPRDPDRGPNLTDSRHHQKRPKFMKNHQQRQTSSRKENQRQKEH